MRTPPVIRRASVRRRSGSISTSTAPGAPGSRPPVSPAAIVNRPSRRRSRRHLRARRHHPRPGAAGPAELEPVGAPADSRQPGPSHRLARRSHYPRRHRRRRRQLHHHRPRATGSAEVRSVMARWARGRRPPRRSPAGAPRLGLARRPDRPRGNRGVARFVRARPRAPRSPAARSARARSAPPASREAGRAAPATRRLAPRARSALRPCAPCQDPCPGPQSRGLSRESRGFGSLPRIGSSASCKSAGSGRRDGSRSRQSMIRAVSGSGVCSGQRGSSSS